MSNYSTLLKIVSIQYYSVSVLKIVILTEINNSTVKFKINIFKKKIEKIRTF